MCLYFTLYHAYDGTIWGCEIAYIFMCKKNIFSEGVVAHRSAAIDELFFF